MKDLFIYIIDDDVFYTSILEQKLKNLGINSIKTFSDLEVASDQVEEEFPDLIFLDIFFEDKNSFDTLSFIKKIKPNILVIMISTKNDKEIIDESYTKGAYKFINKNNKFDEELKNILEEVQANKKDFT